MRLVQVGLGRWGSDWAESVLPADPDIDVVGYVDSNPAALASLTAAGMPPERCFGSLDAAIVASDPDAVLVTTNVPGHFPVAEAALRAGRNVLMEKPFAGSLAQAQALVALADESPGILMISQNYRFFPAVRAARAIVAGGELGELLAVEVDFRRRLRAITGGVTPTPPTGDSHPLLSDVGIHHFDLMRAVIGRDAQEIDCRAWVSGGSVFAGPASATAIVSFGDVVLSYRGTLASANEQTGWAGVWRMVFEQGEVLWTCRGEDGDVVRIRRPDGTAEAVSMPNVSHVDRAGALHEFVTAIRACRAPETAAADNIRSFAMVGAAIESARTGAPVKVGVSIDA